MKLNRNILLFLPLIILIILTFPQPKSNTPQITQEAASTVNEELVEKENIGYGTHIVQPGQNLHTIAIIYYRNPNGWGEIAQANNLSNPDILLIDQELIIPDYQPIGQILTGVSIEAILKDSYIVEKGDSLSKISERAYGTPSKYIQLALFNNITNPDHIEPGWTIRIPREIK